MKYRVNTLAYAGDEEFQHSGDWSDRSDVAETLPTRGASTGEFSSARESIPSRYRFLEVLGSGGMGEVLACYDRWVGREVAIKVMHREHAHREDLRGRFLRETRVQAQLEHRGIAPVYDIGFGADNLTYFTMKRLEGETLEQVLTRLRDDDAQARSEYPRTRLIEAIAEVCSTIAFAHARNIVHRDIKPANVMLEEDGPVRVLDWGVAKVEGLDEPLASSPIHAAPKSGQTDAGAALGTPGYMPPEQVSRSHQVDTQADVYSLGAMLFEVLTLEPLHLGETVHDLLTSTLGTPSDRPSGRHPAWNVPEDLDRLSAAATDPNPDERPTAAEMRDVVVEHLRSLRKTEWQEEMAQRHVAQGQFVLAQASVAKRTDAVAARARAVAHAEKALALVPAHAEAEDLRRQARPGPCWLGATLLSLDRWARRVS